MTKTDKAEKYLDEFVQTYLEIPFKTFKDFEEWCNKDIKTPILVDLSKFFIFEIEKARADELKKLERNATILKAEFCIDCKRSVAEEVSSFFNKEFEDIVSFWQGRIDIEKKSTNYVLVRDLIITHAEWKVRTKKIMDKYKKRFVSQREED